MSKKENEPKKSQTFNTQGYVLSKGSWGENISWEFILSADKPDRSLCTAVCCITTFDKKLLLVSNKRGWEFPAGKIEEHETEEQAVMREVEEETLALITNPQLFGYKKLTTIEPVSRPDQPASFYPFPHSFVVFFHAETVTFSDKSPSADVKEVKLASYAEAQELLAPHRQYENIVEYLLEHNLIALG